MKTQEKDKMEQFEPEVRELTHEEKKHKLEVFKNKMEQVENNPEECLFLLGELNSFVTKGYGPKSNWEQDIYKEKDQAIPRIAEILQRKGWDVKIGDDYLSYDNQSKNVIYFEKDGVQVSFHGHFSNLDYPQAAKDEWNGLYDAYKYRTAKLQEEAKQKQARQKKENEQWFAKNRNEFNKFLSKELDKKIKKGEISPEEKEKVLSRSRVYLDTNTYNPFEIKQMIDEKRGIKGSVIGLMFDECAKLEKKWNTKFMRKNQNIEHRVQAEPVKMFLTKIKQMIPDAAPAEQVLYAAAKVLDEFSKEDKEKIGAYLSEKGADAENTLNRVIAKTLNIRKFKEKEKSDKNTRER